MNKINVGVIFGGRSAEHEVSLQSVQNVVEAIDVSKFDVYLFGISKAGKWQYYESLALHNSENPKTIALDETMGLPLMIDLTNISCPFYFENKHLPIDVVLPILHGPYGEDGTLQGLLKLINIPCVGSSVLGSAIGMDKEIMKRLLREAGLPIGEYLTIRSNNEMPFAAVVEKLGPTLFIKPANMGSSVGVSKVTTEHEYKEALTEALRYDSKVLIERAVTGREIECAVLGNVLPQVSAIGEIALQKDFYSYNAKYIDEQGAVTIIPAEIDDISSESAKKLAVEVFKTLECRGLGRVDMFLLPDGGLLVNEINTLPGFTNISMYPKLWEEEGISYSQLISSLIAYALE